MIKRISVTSKYLRISPSKLDKILKQIRGKTYVEAVKYLKDIPQKSGLSIWKNLRSAGADAEHNFKIQKETTYISTAFVNRASILKRIQPRAKGKAFKIEKKFSHLTICLEERSNKNMIIMK